MGKIFSSVFFGLVALGVAWGMIQVLGDGSDFLSTEWFDRSSEKFEEFQEETSDKLMDSLPDPEKLTD